METFFAQSFVRKLQWVDNFLKKWIQSRYNDDNSFLKVSFRTFFVLFPAVAPQCLKEFLIEVRNEKYEEYLPKTLYHLASMSQMFLKDQDSKVDIFEDKAHRSFRLAMDKT